MTQWKTLEERIIARDRADYYTPIWHVRAELDRLARKVRKLDGKCPLIYRRDVLALLREARL